MNSPHTPKKGTLKKVKAPVHPTLQGASRTTSFNGVDLMDYLCTYISMVHYINTPTHPSPHSRTLVRPPTPIVAHLCPLQPPHPHLAGSPNTAAVATSSSSRASAVIRRPSQFHPLPPPFCFSTPQLHHSRPSHPQASISPCPHYKFTAAHPFTLPLMPSSITPPWLTTTTTTTTTTTLLITTITGLPLLAL